MGDEKNASFPSTSRATRGAGGPRKTYFPINDKHIS